MTEELLAYARSFIGVPYKWGGNNPLTGWDCSGFVQEVLKAFGYLGRGDHSSQMIYEVLLPQGESSKLAAGAILFFGKDVSDINHVAIAVNDYCMIEAGGGNSSTNTLDAAKKKNAYVRIRPVLKRKDLVAAIKLP